MFWNETPKINKSSPSTYFKSLFKIECRADLATAKKPLFLSVGFFHHPSDVKPIKAALLSQDFFIFDQFKVFSRFTFEELLNLKFIFRRQDTAGRIDQLAARLEHGRIALENLLLSLPNLVNGFKAEFPLGVRISSQHPQS